MKHSSTTLLSVLALSVLTACGGGGHEPTGTEVVAAASPAPPTAERAVTIVSRDSPAFKAAHAGANTSQPSSDSVPQVDPRVAQRVQTELDRIESALHQLDNSKIEKHEALEIVSDVRAELRRDRPNKLRLRSLLNGLSRGVLTMDVKGAGDFLGPLIPMV